MQSRPVRCQVLDLLILARVALVERCITVGGEALAGLPATQLVRFVPNKQYDYDVDERSGFVEEAGLYFERLGMSRTAGRIMGLLLTSGAEGGDAPELCQALGVAKSSASVALRRLEQTGLVERFRLPGMRRDRYRLTDDVFGRAFRAQMDALPAFVALAEHGIAVVGDEEPQRRRLERMRDMYAFMAERFPELLDEWESSQ